MMPDRIRILLIGEERDGDLIPTFRHVFQSMGHHVQTFDHGVITMKMARSLFWKAVHKITPTPSAYFVTRRLKSFLRQLPPKSVDLALVCQGMYLFPEVLRELKERTGCLLFNWQTGDYFSPTLSSQLAIQGIPFYDCILAHGAFDIPRCLQAGARMAEYLPLGCNPDLYTPIADSVSQKPEIDVIFVGHWRPEREKLLEALVGRNFPHSLEVWGFGWRNGRPKPTSPLYQYVKFQAPTWANMGATIRRGRIALAFLSRFDTGKVVAPLRLFEIPAVGAFMLAERGQGEPLEFFQEDVEMGCFGDAEDLQKKIAYYLAHDEERLAIRMAGQERVRKSGYLASDRLEQVLEVYRKLRSS